MKSIVTNFKKRWVFAAVAFVGLLMMGPKTAQAATQIDPTIWTSSYVASGVQTTTNLPLPRAGCKFHGVVVSSGSGGLVTIYDSVGTATNPLTAINKATAGAYYFDVRFSSGCTYSNTGTAPITILYAPLF